MSDTEQTLAKVVCMSCRQETSEFPSATCRQRNAHRWLQAVAEGARKRQQVFRASGKYPPTEDEY